MFGICYDDYDYKRVNQIMDIKLKSYVKQVRGGGVDVGDERVFYVGMARLDAGVNLPFALGSPLAQVICFPENVTLSDYTSALPFLRQDEVCHVLLLAIESRRQSELLYALNALMAHVNG